MGNSCEGCCAYDGINQICGEHTTLRHERRNSEQLTVKEATEFYTRERIMVSGSASRAKKSVHTRRQRKSSTDNLFRNP